jgi:hypothetical protein
MSASSKEFTKSCVQDNSKILTTCLDESWTHHYCWDLQFFTKNNKKFTSGTHDFLVGTRKIFIQQGSLIEWQKRFRLKAINFSHKSPHYSLISLTFSSYLKVVRDLYELSLNFTISHLRIIFNLNISKFLIVSSCSGNLDTSCFRALIIEDSASFLASVLDSFFSSSSVSESRNLGTISYKKENIEYKLMANLNLYLSPG